MAFNATPSQLWRDIFWNVTYEDLKTKCKLYVGKEQAIIVQHFQTFHKVAALALGTDKDSNKPENDPNVNMMVPKSAAEAKLAFAKVFG